MKEKIFNSLKENQFTVIIGAVGIGKTAILHDIYRENNLLCLDFRVSMLSKGDLDNFDFVIKQDTIIILDDIDRASLSLECEINRFIHRAKNLKTENNVYLCATMSNSGNDLSEVLKEISFNVINYDITVESYIEYMGDRLIPEISEFLKKYPMYFNSFDANPRNWSRLTDYLLTQNNLIEKQIKEVSHMFVGLAAKKALVKFNYKN